jgi:23S rRNA (adenine2030-N6)-methyltransferase
LAGAHRKWPNGIYMLWYPIKTRDSPDALARRLRRLGLAKTLRCELSVRPPQADAGLIGSGLIIVNPPYTIEQELRSLLPFVDRLLSASAAYKLDWLTAEGG